MESPGIFVGAAAFAHLEFPVIKHAGTVRSRHEPADITGSCPEKGRAYLARLDLFPVYISAVSAGFLDAAEPATDAGDDSVILANHQVFSAAVRRFEKNGRLHRQEKRRFPN